jgi:hypothetical protein
MPISSLPTNTSLQNTPRYQFSNDENCIQDHLCDATVSKMAAKKISKLLMVSDFNEN